MEPSKLEGVLQKRGEKNKAYKEKSTMLSARKGAIDLAKVVSVTSEKPGELSVIASGRTFHFKGDAGTVEKFRVGFEEWIQFFHMRKLESQVQVSVESPAKPAQVESFSPTRTKATRTSQAPADSDVLDHRPESFDFSREVAPKHKKKGRRPAPPNAEELTLSYAEPVRDQLAAGQLQQLQAELARKNQYIEQLKRQLRQVDTTPDSFDLWSGIKRGDPRAIDSANVDVTRLRLRHTNALHVAVEMNHVDLARRLIEESNATNAHDLINSHDDCGNTPLLIAIDLGHFEIAKMLLRASDVTMASRSGLTALHAAAISEDARLAELLLSKFNVPVDAADNRLRWTALHYAASTGREDVVKVLLKYGADTTAASGRGHTAKTIASREGFLELSSLL